MQQVGLGLKNKKLKNQFNIMSVFVSTDIKIAFHEAMPKWLKFI